MRNLAHRIADYQDDCCKTRRTARSARRTSSNWPSRIVDIAAIFLSDRFCLAQLQPISVQTKPFRGPGNAAKNFMWLYRDQEEPRMNLGAPSGFDIGHWHLRMIDAAQITAAKSPASLTAEIQI
jgi:hypothetical protein